MAQPWPKEPRVTPLVHGWTVWKEQFERLLSKAFEMKDRYGRTPTFLEIGGWLGKTSTYLLETYPDLHLVVVDTWRNSGIKHERAEVSFDTWQANVWPWKDRVYAVRTRSECGMIALAQIGYEPDVVYIDAAHDYAQVYLDVAVACACFPRSLICGDDYSLNVRGDELGVRGAVELYAKRTGRVVRTQGRFWEFAG